MVGILYTDLVFASPNNMKTLKIEVSMTFSNPQITQAYY